MSYEDNFRPKAPPNKIAQPKKIAKNDSGQIADELPPPTEKSTAAVVPADIAPAIDEKITTDENPTTLESLEEGSRAGDNMIDRPKGVPQPFKIDPRADPAAATSIFESTEAEKIKVEIDDLLHHSEFTSQSFLRSSFWVLALTLILALLLLYISAQSISILHDALALPDPGRWLVIGLLSLLVGVIVYVIVQAVLFMARLSRGTQLDIEQLVSLSNFSGLDTYRTAIREFLQPYLKELVSQPQKNREKFLQMAGAEEIIESANSLLDEKRRIGSREWVNEFVQNIQLPMEALALERINEYARAAALKTAISPWPLVDMASVVYNSTRMLTDLAIIFNRRFSRANTVRILTGMFFTIFIAGQTQDAIDAIEGELGHKFASGAAAAPDAVNVEDHLSTFAESAFEHAGHGALIFAKFSTKKFAEGAASWLLMKRLGRRAIKMLKPIAGNPG